MDVKQFTYPPLIGGLSSYRSASVNNPGYAKVLDNWICTTTGIRPRGGKRKHATLGASQVHSFMQYNSTLDKLFAVSGGALYDITVPASPSTPPATILTGLGAGFYSSTGFSTAGGQFLIAVNGTASHLHYDGTTWTQPNDITGTTSVNFSAVWQYKSRLFFAINGKAAFAYLPVNNKAGAAATYPLTAILERGGEIVAGTTWSNDAGSGQDDRMVLWTTNGEVLVFTGTDPGTAATWALVQRYDIPRPLGKNAFMRVGGDVLIGTVEGPVALSEIQAKDPAALSFVTLTKEIKPDWDVAVKDWGLNKNWVMEKWPERNIGILGVPQSSTGVASQAYCWAVNLKTGAISRLTNHDIQSLTVFNGRCFFGGNNGVIYEADTGGTDDGSPYFCNAVSWFDDFASTAETKQFMQAMPVFEHATPFNYTISAHVNYAISDPKYTSAAADDANLNLWDVASWDNAVWQSNSVQKRPRYAWDSLGNTGFTAAIGIGITIANTLTPVVELREVNVSYEEGNSITTASTGLVINRDVGPAFNNYTAEGDEYAVRVFVASE